MEALRGWPEIFKIDNTLTPIGSKPEEISRDAKNYLASVIDDLGVMSTEDQGLKKLVTTTEKFRQSPSQTIYMLRDIHGDRCTGAIIGLLKVGPKKLFLYDFDNTQHEVSPLCILDFFIAREHQRVGRGKQLFDFMIHDLNANPHKLAVDGPSDLMMRFMRKHYGWDHLAPQAYNFAVSADFFEKAHSSTRVPHPREAFAAGQYTPQAPRCQLAPY